MSNKLNSSSKRNIKSANKDYTTAIIYIIAVILIGGFFDWAVALCTVLIMIGLLKLIISDSRLQLINYRGIQCIPAIALAASLITTIWAVDRVDNMMGSIRLLAVILFQILAINTSIDDQKNTLGLIPDVGSVMVIVSVLAYFSEALRPTFWEKLRMSGVFQYSNTAALFFALGIVVLVQHFFEKKKQLAIAEIVTLMVGVLLTGSRSILLILLMWGTYKAIRSKALRLPFIVTVVGTAVIVAVVYLVTGSDANVGRLFASSSTLWGRLLYYRDGMDMLIHNPLGLGYMGYYYSQGLYATGVYTTRFIHNDFLQLGIDFGIPTMVLVLVYVVWQMVKGRQSADKKEMLAIIVLASLLDFSGQYLCILFTAVLCLDQGEGVTVDISYIRPAVVTAMCLFALPFLYIAVATGSGMSGNYEACNAMLPNYTYTQLKALTSEQNPMRAKQITDNIIAHNSRAVDAYVFRAYIDAMNDDIEQMIDDMDHAIELAPYNVGIYQTYAGLLSDVGHESEIDALRQRLAAMERRTSPLAYKINDKPNFEM